eukprot:TRINITY_DN2895_c0_g1_i2.p1 TRINITY_DN2895_c0_g1~~TRINITY_DN2895_c0_g1_i2.p1  ORF type:complete len:111 (+),score=1.60 TRINITY_DN2895_c0_g1_i2:707-1039(+)
MRIACWELTTWHGNCITEFEVHRWMVAQEKHHVEPVECPCASAVQCSTQSLTHSLWKDDMHDINIYFWCQSHHRIMRVGGCKVKACCVTHVMRPTHLSTNDSPLATEGNA